MKANKLVFALSAILCAGVLSGCGEEQREPGVLSIMAYNGGYGDEWLETICNKYMEETGNIVTYDTDSTILSKIENQLTQTSDYDIFMSHGLAWQSYAERGLLADLDDLYDSNNKDGDKFSDRVIDEAKDLCKYENRKTGETHYYKVPFTQGAGGLVYNMDMFEQYGWKIPETYADLVALCAKIKADTKGAVTPFAWSKDRDYYWDYPIYAWWYELAGEDTYNQWLSLKGDDGTYTTGYENFDPDGDYAAFKQAFTMWYDLVAKNSDYSNDRAYGASLITAQNLFYTGKAAMIPYGQWAKKEIELTEKKDFTFDIAMMPTPTVREGATHNNFMVGFGDSMIIPENSPNKDLAKDFLRFMSTEFACKTFVEKARGPFLAFDYSAVDLGDITASDTYVASIKNILETCNNFSTASNNPIIVTMGDTVVQPWVNNQRYYVTSASNPTESTIDDAFTTLYNYVKNNWTSWLRGSGIDY